MNINSILAELRAERDRIERAIAAIEALDSTGRRKAGRPFRTMRKHSRFSAATRARMAVAQRARWAKARPTASKRARRMSQAARNRIAAAQRARWAKVKAQQQA
jgi:hypothetical protein